MMSDFLNGSFSDITNNLLNFLYYLLDFLFGWINIPQIPDNILNSIDSFLNLIFDNLSLLGFFIRPTTLKIIIPLCIAAFTFKYVYKVIIFVIKKIPFLNIN